jgi:hypothetical protein
LGAAGGVGRKGAGGKNKEGAVSLYVSIEKLRHEKETLFVSLPMPGGRGSVREIENPL